VEEVIARSEEAEREALLNICQQPLAGTDCIQAHHYITQLLVRDYERHGRNSWMVFDIRAQRLMGKKSSGERVEAPRVTSWG